MTDSTTNDTPDQGAVGFDALFHGIFITLCNEGEEQCIRCPEAFRWGHDAQG